MQATRIDLLQRMPIFGAIGDDALRFLLAEAHPTSVRAGEYFFREGDQASSLFVLESGRVAVLKSWREREVLLHHLGPGDCFGEMALLDLQARSASVRALDDCRAIELAPSDLYRLCKHDTEQFALIQMNIARELSRRLRAADELLFEQRMRDETGDSRLSN